MAVDDALPIDDVIGDLRAALATHEAAVLVAPPGAGKTTRVPLVLLDEPWAKGGKLILLEPRRLAARGAAERMAATLGERVGETIGLRARFDTRVSKATRIEVVTEGVFTRMILDDPALEGIAGVLFDEYHERSLDADFGLALALDAQVGLRDDLRLLVMSATLDGARVAGLLGGAPVIESAGRAHPVVTHYLGRDPDQRLDEAVTAAVLRALASEPGSVLAFLPGAGEIARVATRLAERLRDPTVDIAPLHGTLDKREQDRAVSPAPPGRRKVVLATAIAESSLTIEGVRVVVDGGMARVPRFEPDLGLTRLETVRVSRASADQRRGRAGRTEPGVCYRLWEEAGTGALQPFGTPEIRNADLSGLLLDCALWGTRDPLALRWLDAPPRPAIKEARSLLLDLGAIDAEGAITPRGRAMAGIAAPPRLARMVVEAAARGTGALGGAVATLLVERGLGGEGADVEDRLGRWGRDRSARADSARGLARAFTRQAEDALRSQGQTMASTASLGAGAVLGLGFPDRIAKARGRPGEMLMANGRAAAVEPHERLAGEPFLAIGEVAGRAGAARVLLAAPITPEEIEAVAGAAIVETDAITFDPLRAALARRRDPTSGGRGARRAEPARSGRRDRGGDPRGRRGEPRPGPATLEQGAGTVARPRALPAPRGGRGRPWPDLSNDALAARAADWLAPFVIGRTSLAAITGEDLSNALHALLPFDLARRLEAEAPTHFEAPTGSRVAVDYEAEGAPVLAIRVQELFGLREHPALARGRVPLTLHLLSPAHRPIQVTSDLPGFWRGSWAAVKADMKGRYPRHPWPDDPAAAPPTARAKPRGT